MDTGGKRQALKSASTDLETADVVLGQVLKVTDLPKGSTRAEADKLFTQFAMSGAKIRWLKDAQGLPGDGWGQWGLGGGHNNGTAHRPRCYVLQRPGGPECLPPPQQLCESLQTSSGQKELGPEDPGAGQPLIGRGEKEASTTGGRVAWARETEKSTEMLIQT